MATSLKRNNAPRKGGARGTPLPVVARPPPIRRSRMGRWRAAVLIGVHVVAAVHIAHWASTGRTLSPLEPSESMEFSKHGVINAGLIFFSLAILSTLVLGRWFCGWGCHVVALQDFSRWVLGLVRIRPRPLRSSVLGVVPLLAFLYMFVAPPLYGLAARLSGVTFAQPWTPAYKLTTSGFWDTFPGPLPAILTFLVCGFVVIYVLGAKGFCTYGCPYGAIFGAVDRFAPLRIRVTDACTGSGHCTAVCTSNVRVHEEVRDFKMVVDPGCMKCLDCVSVCPNDALYVGWGMPAAGAKAVAASPKPRGRRWLASVGGWALLGGFAVAALAIFHGFDLPRRFQLTPTDWAHVGIMSALTLLIVALFRAKSRRPRESSLGEELLLAVFFLAAMLAFRGLHEAVPFLFALGLSVVVAFVLTQACLLASRRQLSFHGFRLKREGRLQPAAVGFLAIALGLAAFAAYGGTVQRDVIQRRNLHARLAELQARAARPDATAQDVQNLLDASRELTVRDPAALDPWLTLGYLLTSRGQFDQARAVYAEAAEHHGKSAQLMVNRGIVEAAQGKVEQALPWFSQAVVAEPSLAPARLALADAFFQLQRWPQAAEQYAAAAKLAPRHADAHFGWALSLAQMNELEQAEQAARRAAELAPERPDIRDALTWIQQVRAAPKPGP